MTFLRPFNPCVFVLIIALSCAALSFSAVLTPAWAAGADQYAQSYKAFRELLDSPQAKFRDRWIKVIKGFERNIKVTKDKAIKGKSLYYIGRSWEELGTRSFLKSDNRKAVQAFDKAASAFPPGHSWIDDCLFREASIRALKLHEKTRARGDLQALIVRYPKGDQIKNARALLAELGGAHAAKPKSSAQKSTPKPQKKISDLGKKDAEKAYYQAVRQYKSLKGKARAGSDSWRTLAAEFKAVHDADPKGPYSAKSLYFLGFVHENLKNYPRSTAYFGQAVETFPAKHTWVDDALYKKAEIHLKKLNERDQAYSDLLKIVHNHASGDNASKAKALLRELDKAELGNEMEGNLDVGKPQTFKLPPKSASAGFSYLTNIRYRSGRDFTRIVIDLENKVGFDHQTLPPDPGKNKTHRMFIDLEDVRLRPGIDTSIDIADGFLRRVRAAQNRPDLARVVLDFQERKKYHVFTLENPYRVVVDVFADPEHAPKAPVQTRSTAKTLDRKPGKKETAAAKDILSQLGMTVKTVMIDPGHGGRDPGAIKKIRVKDKNGKFRTKTYLVEKDVTLKLALKLGKQLQAKGYKVHYTRTRDVYVSLEDRAVMANLKNADLFLSIHVNANNNKSVRGFETYFLGKAKNDLVLKLAAKENGVDPMRISDTQKIVMDLVHSFKVDESRNLAGFIQKRSVSTLRGKYKNIKSNGARSAPFFVLIGAQMPAVLVEVGYLSNFDEAKRLKDNSYLDNLAKGIVNGMESYVKELRLAGL
jgi:N-acetylmuramoyl-L-alanine amidase